MELTIEKLKTFGDNEIFATGTGTYPEISKQEIRWVAVAGNGYYDWTIYYHLVGNSKEFIAREGDKCFSESVIKRLVPCTNESYALYRT